MAVTFQTKITTVEEQKFFDLLTERGQLSIVELLANSFTRLIKADIRNIVYNNNKNDYKNYLLTFYESLYSYFYQNDPSKIQAFLSNVLTQTKTATGISRLLKMIPLFEKGNQPLFSRLTTDSFEDLEPSPEEKQEAAALCCHQLFVNVCHINEIYLVLGSQLAYSKQKSKASFQKLFHNFSSLPLSLKIKVRSFVYLYGKNHRSDCAVSFHYGSEGIEQRYKKQLLPQNQIEASKVLSHLPLLPKLIKEVREIFNWAVKSLLETKTKISMLEKTYCFLKEEDASKKLILLDALNQKDPVHFPFNDILKKQIDQHIPKEMPVETKGWKEVATFTERLLTCIYVNLEEPLDRAEKLRPWLFLPKKPSVDTPPQPVVKKESPKKEEVAPPPPAALKKIEVIEKESPIPEPTDKQLQKFRMALHQLGNSYTSSFVKSAFFHLNSLLVRLFNLKISPKTEDELLGFCIGLAHEGHLALESILSEIMIKSNRDAQLTHRLVDLLYRSQVKREFNDQTREAIFSFDRSEILSRNLYRCRTKANEMERLLADVWAKKPSAELLPQALEATRKLVLSFLDIAGELKESRVIPQLTSTFETAFEELQKEYLQFKWEDSKIDLSSQLQARLEKLFVKIPAESLKESLGNLTQNFLKRLQLIEKKLNPLQPTHAALTLSDSRLLAQMAAEELFYLILDLKGIDYDQKEIDHRLNLQIEKLEINFSIFTSEEMAFLRSGKETRRQMRYPDGQEFDLKNAMDLANKHLLDSTDLLEKGFKIVGPDQKTLSRTTSLVKNQIDIFHRICNKVLDLTL